MEAPTPHEKLSKNHFGYFYGMGSGIHTETNPHALTWRLPGVTNDFIAKYETYGANVCVRHRPFGETLGGPMDWDQAVTIKNDEEWSWIIDQYHTETAKLTTACPDAIIIDYIGKVEDQLEYRRKNGMYSQLLHRLWGGVQPMMNHPVWIGFDAASGVSYPDGSVYHHFCEAVTACKREQGQDVVVEALPAVENDGDVTRSAEWVQDKHALCLERFYQHRIKKHPTGFRYTHPTASTLRVANGHSRWAWVAMQDAGIDPIKDFAQSCFDNEHTPIFAMPGYEFADFADAWKQLIH